MNQELVDKVAKAVLYEGYILYPYRPSVKNRQRWTFGGLYPPNWSKYQGGNDPFAMQTQCLFQGSGQSQVEIRVRFLHLQMREVKEIIYPVNHLPEDCEQVIRLVERFEVDGRLYQTWQEAVKREICLEPKELGSFLASSFHKKFSFPGNKQVESHADQKGEVKILILRKQNAVKGTVEVTGQEVAEGLFKLTVRIENKTAFEVGNAVQRDAALMNSFVSTHTILWIEAGTFVSLLDPPAEYADLAAGCTNVGTWPVLVGENGARDTMLSSPIILYDYPQIAPESQGDLFDSTEIDEILTLRILTLTEDEKRAMSSVDERTRALLERTESIGLEQLMGLHGTLRGLRPVGGE